MIDNKAIANNLLLYVTSLYEIIMANIPTVSIGKLRSNLASYLNSFRRTDLGIKSL
ncbi:MAG: hypothetical protein AAFQ80_05655 [Cyanobacteria bacterium J06621_8]